MVSSRAKQPSLLTWLSSVTPGNAVGAESSSVHAAMLSGGWWHVTDNHTTIEAIDSGVRECRRLSVGRVCWLMLSVAVEHHMPRSLYGSR